MDSLLAVLAVLVVHLPALIAELVVIVLAVSRWNRFPRAAMLVSSGGALLLLNTLVASVLVLVPMKLQERGFTTSEMGKVLGVVGLVQSLLYSVGLALVVAAVFADRDAPPREGR